MADSEPRAGSFAHPHEREALLLVARPSDAGAVAYCREHLATGPPGASAPLVVLTHDPVREERRRWYADDRPGVVVSVGDSTRSAAGTVQTPVEPCSPPETVVATGDLGNVGRTVDDHLTAWVDAGHRPTVCVDSLAGLVEYASVEASYRFLYVLLRRVQRAGGAAHAHADPRDHEEEILRTFHGLFDRVISFSDGSSPHR